MVYLICKGCFVLLQHDRRLYYIYAEKKLMGRWRDRDKRDAMRI